MFGFLSWSHGRGDQVPGMAGAGTWLSGGSGRFKSLYIRRRYSALRAPVICSNMDESMYLARLNLTAIQPKLYLTRPPSHP